MGFSVYNAVSEGAFKITDAADFVFSASAAMESVGLAVMLLLSLTLSVKRSHQREVEEGVEKGEFLEAFGSPLAILAGGLSEKYEPQKAAGYFGSMCQAVVVGVMGLVLLSKVDTTAFVVLLCVILSLLICCLCSAAAVESGRDNQDELDVNPCGSTAILVLLPLSVDVAEVVFLALIEGRSWDAIILAFLDVVVTFFVVLPWACNKFVVDGYFCFLFNPCVFCFQLCLCCICPCFYS